MQMTALLAIVTISFVSAYHHEDYHHYPKYKYEYGVKDPHTHDHKSAWEHRDGDHTKGKFLWGVRSSNEARLNSPTPKQEDTLLTKPMAHTASSNTILMANQVFMLSLNVSDMPTIQIIMDTDMKVTDMDMAQPPVTPTKTNIKSNVRSFQNHRLSWKNG